MNLLFIADARSPTAISWISHFIGGPHEIHLVSTFDCSPLPGLASFARVPVAFSGLRKSGRSGGDVSRPPLASDTEWIQWRTRLRDWIGPVTLGPAARRLREIVDRCQPALIHALRIPYEGMLAAAADPAVPLVISCWGNDFTLHAVANPLMGRQTRKALSKADGLLSDCRRDLRLAREWGFPAERKAIVLPGNGGVPTDIFHPGDPMEGLDGSPLALVLESLPPGAPVVVNPRGLRTYIRNDTFFAAIPRVLAKVPEARFLCPAMAGRWLPAAWLNDPAVSSVVKLLPQLSRAGMAAVYRRSAIVVSPSEHDGTPNTLLEGMACGCYPVAGDLESVREWIDSGVNGLLFDPGDPQGLADAIVEALRDRPRRNQAAKHNHSMILERAERDKVMAQAEAFYGYWLA